MSTAFDAGKTLPETFRIRDVLKAAHYLTLAKGGIAERAVPITTEPLILGRDPSRPFHLPDPDVSRSHCSVRLVGDQVLVRDLGSTNGTFVDGTRVREEVPLPVSSRLQIGRHGLKHDLLRPDEAARLE